MRRPAAVAFAVLLAVPAAASGLTAELDASAEATADASDVLTPRGSIFIDREVGPTGFILGYTLDGEPIHNTAMGVRGGNGTAEDPYVISNWTVHHTAPFAIKLANTTAPVVIENITIPGEGVQTPTTVAQRSPTITDGIDLANAENVTVEDTWIRHVGAPGIGDFFLPLAGTGIRLWNTHNISVQETRLGPLNTAQQHESFFLGLRTFQANNTEFRNLSVTHAFGLGLVRNSSNLSFQNSTFLDRPQSDLTQTSMQLHRTENIRFTDSLFQATDLEFNAGVHGLLLEGNRFNATKANGLSAVTDQGLIEPDDANNAIDADDEMGSAIQICGNRFEHQFFRVFDIAAQNSSIRGNLVANDTFGEVESSGKNTTVEHNGFYGTNGLEVFGEGSEVHNNTFVNSTSLFPSEIWAPTDASHNWWGDPDGPNLTDREGFSQDGDPLELHTERDNVTFKPFLEEPPEVGPSAVDCGDPSTAGAKQTPADRMFGPIDASASGHGVVDEPGISADAS